MRRFGVLVTVVTVAAVCALGLASAGTAEAAVWPTGSTRLDVTVSSQPALAAWVERCAGGQRVMTRQLRSGFATPRVAAPCRAVELTKPALAHTPFGNRTFVVWSQAPVGRSKAVRGVFVAVSLNNGATWGKPRLLMKTTSVVPPPVRAASYVYKLWVMWSSPSTRTQTQAAFNIRPWDVRTWRVGPSVAGIGSFRVFPSADHMQLYATKDGLAAFWRATDKTESPWYFADTERVNAYDVGKRVRFVFRGKAGLEGRANIFVGHNRVLYRLVEETDKTDFANQQTVYKLYRWRFIGHRFAPAYAQAEVLRLPKNLLVSPQIAAQVDAGGNLRLVYAEPTDSDVCALPGLMICDAAAAGQPYASYLKVLRVDRLTNSKTTQALPLPYATNTMSSTAVEIVVNYKAAPMSTLVAGVGGPRLLSSVVLSPITDSPDGGFFLVNSRTPGLKRSFYLSGPLG